MQGEVKPDWNAVWLDSIVLFQAPSASASSPERTDSLSFMVSAVNAQTAPHGTLTGDYDFQVKDGIDGRWRTWRSIMVDTVYSKELVNCIKILLVKNLF